MDKEQIEALFPPGKKFRHCDVAHTSFGAYSRSIYTRWGKAVSYYVLACDYVDNQGKIHTRFFSGKEVEALAVENGKQL